MLILHRNIMSISIKNKRQEILIYPCFSKNLFFAKKAKPTKNSKIPKSFPVKNTQV